ncbi:hypothetical protein OQA88_2625 [Cercophora sp. LCS_1]
MGRLDSSYAPSSGPKPADGNKSSDIDTGSDNRDLVRTLADKIANLEGRGGTDTRHNSLAEPGARTELTDENDSGHPTQLTNANTIPKVRKCNLVQFKNRFSDEDGRYAIDALWSGALLDQEMKEEERFRQQIRSENPGSSSRSAKARANNLRAASNANFKAIEKAQSQETWIQRVRIQSPAVIKILSDVQGETWSSRPRTYFRPFITMVHSHEGMKKALQELEDRWGHVADGHNETPATTVPSTPRHIDDEEPVDNCPAALQAMRCYVKFIDEAIMPQYTQFDSLKASDGPSIRFSDLHYLFRVGELIYRDLGDISGVVDARDGRKTGKRLWKVYDLPSCDTRDYTTLSDQNYGNACEDDGTFIVRAFYLEYTGEEFTVDTMDFRIPPFRGIRRIRSLPIYPVRFRSDNLDQYLSECVALGEKVLDFIDIRHASYDAWTVTRTPKGEPVCDVTGEIEKRSSYINSDVMVDFTEAFQVCDKWKPIPTILRPELAEKSTESDPFSILWWSGPDRSKLLAESTEVTSVRTGVTIRERNKFITTDPLLVTMAENAARGHLTTRAHLRPEDKALIPGRVFAYVFQDRKFAQLDVQHLTASSGSRDALDSLRIEPRIKELIQGSVKGHLQMKADEKRHHTLGSKSQDFIRGKGSGLFILLHGVPGVGKTATAEAIAQTNGKPLFKISCGDLGLTPSEVETSLGSIFRLAESWECILLMDEVDTFFSQRSKGDGAMAKNALVSVFLRILDYYSGILFMTTNRVGALDEAFRSRIHYNILYPALNKTQTMEIWQMNLERLRKIDEEHQRVAGRKAMVINEEEILRFAEDNYANTPRGGAQWNGRQIRNAFQVVRALAYADAATEAERIRQRDPRADVPPPKLGAEQFRVIETLTGHFEEYTREVHGGQSAAEIARESELRADGFAGPNWSGERSLRPTGRGVAGGYQGRVPSPSRGGFEREYGGSITGPGARIGALRVPGGEEEWARPVSPSASTFYGNRSMRGGEYGLDRDERGSYEAEYGDSKNEYGKRGRW